MELLASTPLITSEQDAVEVVQLAGGATQVPDWQVVPDAHECPQVPQLLSDVKSGHCPLQGGLPELVQTQALDEQVEPVMHTFPQAPQLLLPELVSLHAPPHNFS